MGLISQTITFTQGLIPTATQWQNQFDSVYNLVNGQLDSANVDKTSSDGIMVLDTAQTRTGTLTHNGDIVIGNTYGLIIGGATQQTIGGTIGEMQVVGTAAADSFSAIGRWSADASGPERAFLKSRNATIGSFTIIQDNDVLGTVGWYADDGTDYATPGATVFARVDGTPGANDLPTELVFATTADGAATVTEHMALSPAGHLTPLTDSAKDLGTTALRWRTLLVDTLGDTGQALAIAATSVTLPSGHVFSWNSGDVTVTHSANTLTFAGAGSGYTFDSIVFVNDTSNAKMATGITVNQGSADNEWLTGKSSDVTHTATSLTEADTFEYHRKYSATEGGAGVFGISSGTVAHHVWGLATTEDATRSVSAAAPIVFTGSKIASNTLGNMSANKNLIAFLEYGSGARFILDTDGDSHQDVGTAWTNFDDYDDAQLLTALSVTVSREDDPIRREFGHILNESRAMLEAMRGKKIVQFNDDGHHFVNMSRLTMVHTGAIRQIANRVDRALRKLEAHTGLKLLEV